MRNPEVRSRQNERDGKMDQDEGTQENQDQDESGKDEVDTRSHYAKYTVAHKKYEKSQKGKVARERYMNSDKGKAARKRYRAKRDAENKRILKLARDAGIGQN